MRRLRSTLLLLVIYGCASAPPQLSPEAAIAWKGTQVIKALDTVRDMAIAASATVPPLLSTATTRKIVVYHDSALDLVHAAPSGWLRIVEVGLEELLQDLPERDKQLLGSYIGLAQGVIRGLQ